MKARLQGGQLVLTSILIPLSILAQGEPGSVALKLHPGRVELSWPTAITNASAQRVLPEYNVQFSSDLKTWTPMGAKLRGIDGRSGPMLNLSLAEQTGPMFFRVLADPHATSGPRLASEGAESLGYEGQFQEELEPLGLLSVADFATNAPAEPYLSSLTWDPTTAQFWTDFYSGRFNMGYGLYGGNTQWLPYNYQLNESELARFMTNGFVVSERLGAVTFGDAYYRIFAADLPVFITTDSILHAWHRSYQSLLSELEEVMLSTLLEEILTNMAAQLPQAWEQFGGGPLQPSIIDADYFLTVARSLCSGREIGPSLPGTDHAQLIRDTLAAVKGSPKPVPLFGGRRTIDFSLFIVRGHYGLSERLKRYFRTMMWCGHVDLRLATFPPNEEDDIRQLGTALILRHLLEQAGQTANWEKLEQVTRLFVGMADSMSFPDLGDLLTAANINSPADVPDLVTLTNLQTRLLTGELGLQNIQSHFFWSPLSSERVKLPRSFAFTGQKFTLDSWAMTKVVFDQVLWDPTDPSTVSGKVLRRKPSCLDVAFSVFGNDQVVPDIISRVLNKNGVPFRDGLPYQHNLLAVRNTINAQDPSVWTSSLYAAWLSALRALSLPTTAPAYPEAMRTRAWAMKTLNTQLASWTQLRHDTVLYAKQGSTPPVTCSYPAGFVEPRPEFWSQMRQLAELTAEGIAQLDLTGTVAVPGHLNTNLITIDLAALQSKQLAFLTNFSSRMALLQNMSQRELAQQPFTAEQTNMVTDLIERWVDYDGVRLWSGWYPSIYYRNTFNGARDSDHLPWTNGFPMAAECDIRDVLVADVHTDQPDPIVGDPGAVIHEGIGNINMMLIAVDNGPDRMVYAGPALSHYEFETPAWQRLNDSQWNSLHESGNKPAPPPWTDSYLVPGSIQVPTGY